MAKETHRTTHELIPWTTAGLHSIPVAWARFVILPTERCRLPDYLGSTLRGALGRALIQSGSAEARQDFEGVEGLPRFIVRPPPMRLAPWTHQTPLSFDLGLIADAARHFPSWCRAVHAMCGEGLGAARYPFRLIRADDVQHGHCLWSHGRLRSPIRTELVDLTTWRWTDTVDLWLNTPLSLRRDGRFTDRPNVETIIRAIMRRARRLCPTPQDQPYYVPWLKAARNTRIDLSQTEVVQVGRYSNRQRGKMAMKGIRGRIRMVGDQMETLWPLLQIGEQIHCGRYTVFGFGDYTLEPEGREGFIHR